MSQRDSSSDIHHQQLTVPLYFETHPDMTKIHEPWILGGGEYNLRLTVQQKLIIMTQSRGMYRKFIPFVEGLKWSVGSRLLIQYNRCRRRSSVYRFKKCWGTISDGRWGLGINTTNYAYNLSISYEGPNVFSPLEGSFHTALLGLLTTVWKSVRKHIGEAHVGNNIHYPSSALPLNWKKQMWGWWRLTWLLDWSIPASYSSNYYLLFSVLSLRSAPSKDLPWLLGDSSPVGEVLQHNSGWDHHLGRLGGGDNVGCIWVGGRRWQNGTVGGIWRSQVLMSFYRRDEIGVAYFNLPLYAHPSTWAKKAYLQCSAGDLRSPLFLSLSVSSWLTFPQSRGWTSDHGWSWLARRRSCIISLSNLIARHKWRRMVSWTYIANFDHGRASPE